MKIFINKFSSNLLWKSKISKYPNSYLDELNEFEYNGNKYS